MPLRVGIDSLDVARVEEAIAAHGERYLARIFTPSERADCVDDPERLAARFAAKEAALKVLRPDADHVPWHTMEVRRHPSGWVELSLTGRAAQLADRAGIAELALSLTHEGGRASAVVVAT